MAVSCCGAGSSTKSFVDPREDAELSITDYVMPLLSASLRRLPSEELREKLTSKASRVCLNDFTNAPIQVHSFVIATLLGFPLKKGVPIPTKPIDSWGNTLSHYGALRSADLAIGDMNVKNNVGWSAHDMNNMFSLIPLRGKQVARNVFYPYRTAALFFSSYSLWENFCPIPHIETMTPPSECLEMIPDSIHGIGDIARASVFIPKNAHFSSYLGVPLDPDVCLKTNRQLFGIDIKNLRPTSREYSIISSIDASDYGSPATRAPDGPPIAEIDSSKYLGFFMQTYLVALRAIKKGEIVTIFYGASHPVRVMLNYKTYRPFDFSNPTHIKFITMTPALVSEHLTTLCTIDKKLWEAAHSSFSEASGKAYSSFTDTSEEARWKSCFENLLSLINLIQELPEIQKKIAIKNIKLEIRKILALQFSPHIEMPEEPFLIAQILSGLYREKEELIKLINRGTNLELLENWNILTTSINNRIDHSRLLKTNPCFVNFNLDKAYFDTLTKVEPSRHAEDSFQLFLEEFIGANPKWEPLRQIHQACASSKSVVEAIEKLRLIEAMRHKIDPIWDQFIPLEPLLASDFILASLRKFALNAFIASTISKPEYITLLTDIENIDPIPTPEELDEVFALISIEERRDLMNQYDREFEETYVKKTPDGYIDSNILAKIIRQKIYQIMTN